MNRTTFNTTLALACISFLFTLQSCSKTPANPKGYHLVWSDEFSSNKIDTTKWDFQTGTGSQYGLTDWGNNELEYYTPDNAFIEKGNLVIEARKEDKNGKSYTSARLRTMKEDGTALFSKTYGRIEARIKMPKGNGIWPAFWMLPATSDYGVWASSGEIDILEAKGRLANRMYGTVHYGQAWPGNKYSGGMYKFPDDTDISTYHTYTLDWEPGKLTWLVDGNTFYETQQWWSMGKDATEPYAYPAPYDKPFYILLNLALGGNFDGGVAPDDTEFPARMYVDYVRVYDKDEPYATSVTRPEPKRDSTSFDKFTTDDNKSFIFDKDMSTCKTEPATQRGTEDINARVWNFSALEEYSGAALSSSEKIGTQTFRHVIIKKPGNQNYSVQLIQYFPVASGYSYHIEFDAKSKSPRTIAVKIGGDADNSWTVYSPEYHPALTEKVQHFAYFFTMENDTDPTARLEFNLGLDTSDVWISNVTVKEAAL